ncbi:MAG: thioredoxin domain-containing protein [Holosporales bacterium]|nr:thioredoxin domain-containing protein [Holosporales bacterium]
MEKRNCAFCGKVSVALSALALAVAIVGYFRPYRPGAGEQALSNEQVRNAVMEAIRANPQVIVDAMGEGMALKRDEEFKKLTVELKKRMAEVDKKSMIFGDRASKKSVVCILDPLCKHCVDFQRSMIKILNSNKDICFKIMPVAVLGADSVMIARVYVACYKKNPAGALKVIDAIVNYKGEINKEVLEQILKKAGFTMKEIEELMEAADRDIAANGVFAEGLGIPMVPAIFVANVNGDIVMLQATDIEAVMQAANGTAEPQAAPVKKEESDADDEAKEKEKVVTPVS